ncbi:glycoside hydrolase family 2 protein [Microbacterium sp. A196]|uniref:glycoside hydrolase family 2 protein n=1 Tax=Microbacterium sp. A196 TaxID=3457320 RepID=UPI003FD631AC
MSRTTTLLSDFQLAEAALGSTPDALAGLPADAWLPVEVPGGVHESLLTAGRIPHPYRNDNESEVRWVEDRDWWYRCRFTGPTDLRPGEALSLRFLGLDTVADVWLNGKNLGHHENMFRPAEFAITSHVQEDNELLIRFSPPLADLELPTSTETWTRLSRMMPVSSDIMQLAAQRRKAIFSWGWDFSPRVASIGIWRHVELIRRQEAVIAGHHVWTDRIDADGTAHLRLQLEVDRFIVCHDLTATARITTPVGEMIELDVPVEDGIGRSRTVIDIVLPNAELWWTHDLGNPALHRLQLQLEGPQGALDEVEDRIGVRTIELDRSDDPEGGRLFRFILNGVSTFARGAAWIPADMLVGSVSEERYRSLLTLATDGGMTMLRVWGGGVYEHDAFYSLCDELGLLIWHDFMFANAEYPSESSPQLCAEVTAEAEYQVRRLRNRPSLALWCGNNESQLFHGMGYHNLEPGEWGWNIFFQILPDVVAREDGRTPYWPGSPWGEAAEEGFMAPGGVLDGDRHAWEVWHGIDFGAGSEDYPSVGEARHYRRYARDRGKFISEFGIHASPEVTTLRRWIDDDLLSVHSPTFDAHNKDHPKNKGDAILEIITGLPKTMDEYIDFSMVSQSEGLKFGIEHYRHRQPHNNGTLVWQLNDSWPGFSWSIIDYDGVPKAGYYAAKRAFQPVIALFVNEGERLELWLSNSTAAAVAITAEVSLEEFDGTVQLSERVTQTVPAGESVLAWFGPSPADPAIVAWVRSYDGSFPDNRFFFGEIRELPFAPADLAVQIESGAPGSATVTVSANTLAYLVRIPSPAPGVRFSDNYFDVAPGRLAHIEVTGLPAEFDPHELQVHAYAGVRPSA